MSTSEVQFRARTHLCRLCGEPAERIVDQRTVYTGRQPAFAYRACLCGQYVLEHPALFAIDARFNFGHPARRWLSAWIQQTHLNLADPWPVVSLSLVELAARESADHRHADAFAGALVEPSAPK